MRQRLWPMCRCSQGRPWGVAGLASGPNSWLTIAIADPLLPRLVVGDLAALPPQAMPLTVPELGDDRCRPALWVDAPPLRQHNCNARRERNNTIVPTRWSSAGLYVPAYARLSSMAQGARRSTGCDPQAQLRRRHNGPCTGAGTGACPHGLAFCQKLNEHDHDNTGSTTPHATLGRPSPTSSRVGPAWLHTIEAGTLT